MLFVKLRKQLEQHKGKKVYGYLPKQIKVTANEIVAQLAYEPAIEELYKEWSKANREKLSLYYENKAPAVPLVESKEFRSIKNMIIRAVIEIPPEVEIVTSEVSKEENDDESIQIRPRFYVEKPALKILNIPDPPPIVTLQTETIPHNTLAITSENQASI